ncbi:glycosyltransferase family 4 protein [uncultured Chryseobacterium sp.]|uniref:glycosyltransferase family 4 protein n=1 Tax=uncultured Chryseobacterium sp. TaxID=259322 RepID=UPI002631C12E|nr:glycosyltransferase family 4 protein [uncultured Chryseobacterium sp.]
MVIFFFSYHKIGGAEKVHQEILKSISRPGLVLFENISYGDNMGDFPKFSRCYGVKNRYKRKFAVFFINFLSLFMPVTVFGCNSYFFYQSLPKLRNRIKKIDLTHAFSKPEVGVETLSIPFLQYLDKRIVINNRTFEDYQTLYSEHNIPSSLLEKIEKIENGIEIHPFDEAAVSKRFNNFTIGYVGRNSKEKRPEIFLQIVEYFPQLKVKMIGDDFYEFKSKPEITFFEGCNDEKIIRKEFSEISVLILPSSREGFPLVIMEAMELGIPVIATDVGSIKEHINERNGFVFESDKEAFIEKAVKTIGRLVDDKDSYHTLSYEAREYAVKNFDISRFRQKYLELLS